MILGQTVFEIFEGMISWRTNERKLAYPNSAKGIRVSPNKNGIRVAGVYRETGDQSKQEAHHQVGLGETRAASNKRKLACHNY